MAPIETSIRIQAETSLTGYRCGFGLYVLSVDIKTYDTEWKGKVRRGCIASSLKYFTPTRVKLHLSCLWLVSERIRLGTLDAMTILSPA